MELKDWIHSLTDRDSYKRMKAAWELGESGDEKAADLLIDTLADDDPFVKNLAAGALIKIGEPAIPSIIEAMKDEKKEWTTLRKVLGEIGEPAVAPLIDSIRREKDIMSKALLAHAFGDIGEPALVPLLEFIEESGADDRKVGLIGLGDLGKNAIPHLLRMLDNETDEGQKFHIIKALLATNHPAATEHLFRRGLL